MANYVHASTQTKWAGLMQRDNVRPDALVLSPPLSNTPTPPGDVMLTQKPQFMYGGAIPTIAKPPTPDDHPTSPTQTLLERRRNLLGLDARLDMPTASHKLNDEVPFSPPTTHALLSPIPEANKRHAGHTPLIPRSLSPEPERAQEQAADDDDYDRDEGLKGALTLPSNPTDGTDDEQHIGVLALDKVLRKIEKQQKTLRGEFDDDEPATDVDATPRSNSVDAAVEDLTLSRKGSADSRRSNTEEFDGVLLKTPPSNFGAPFGQL